MCLEEEADISPYSSRMHQHRVSIRPHTSAYVRIRQHTFAYVSIRQHTSERDLEEEAYITILIVNASEYVSIRQRTSAYVSICQRERDLEEEAYITILIENALKVEGLRHPLHQPLHTSAYVSIRQHTSAAYVNIHTYIILRRGGDAVGEYLRSTRIYVYIYTCVCVRVCIA